ncbi:TRAP transporter substrate-binding protein [Pseudarthrobacter niigatensis]|uniref:TRAP-type C4-dicarboxylate transport system substrate-binding protein n=1 Tax=Pseudarthrobacter niigatensis TaxID=369935 RepID=A0AAJ1WFR4_9MICC|nr:TRAP transporter substrate-binding protein DctP [Pseudarthrobacter niigatensis]MDQ0146110.1 TRAP-type C4-dicarboxylate transport system substrate-binding protein [Pseudarthrobacter niigatensis]MDQ0266162.1 TRAP-type C4-dicarboxylate transport system substrate-binding protein [Pseudarthrobacter niigatensis]
MKSAQPWAALVVIGILLGATSCTYEDSTEDPPTRAGTTTAPSPKVLRIGTQDDAVGPTRGQIEEFARQVQARSHRTLVVDPVYRAGGDSGKGWDQVVARRVMGGDLEMAVVPARTWDTEGVLDFRALSAPFLVTSSAVIKEVVKPEHARGMLASLESAGVTGLALFPDGPRMLFSFTTPILTLADVKGMVVRAPLSDTTFAVLAALGAIPVDLADQEFGDGVARGTVGGAESSMAYAQDLPTARNATGRAIATGNLVVHSKISTLVINNKARAALTGDEQRILQEAADATREWASALFAPLSAEARKYCEGGGKVVVATEQELAAFRAASAPVYGVLEQDADTRELIGRVQDLAARTPADPAVKPCDYDTY